MTITEPTISDALARLDRAWVSIVTKLGNGDSLDAIASLAVAVRDQTRPLPPGKAGRMAREAEHAARTMAPPVPGVTVNPGTGHVVRAAIYLNPRSGGLLESWAVACEHPQDGTWVTWIAYATDRKGHEGTLVYDAGNYCHAPDPAANRSRALADLAIRAGVMGEVGLRIADEIVRYHKLTAPFTTGEVEDKRMASRLRKWCRR